MMLSEVREPSHKCVRGRGATEARAEDTAKLEHPPPKGKWEQGGGVQEGMGDIPHSLPAAGAGYLETLVVLEKLRAKIME